MIRGDNMRIKWLGHSCFKICSEFNILIDPYDESLTYTFDPGEVNIILESHQHSDHCAHDRVSGDPAIVKTPGEHLFNKVRIFGVGSFHDEDKGTKRGTNIIFKIETEGFTVVHMGDLGQALDHKQVEQLQDIDVLMIPVGGTYTIDYKAAVETVKRLNPKIVLPMHYKTEFCPYPIDGYSRFTERLGWEIRKLSVLEINNLKLNELYQTCIIFDI